MLIGYELFFSAVKSDLKNGEDAFVVAVHWTLIHNGYKCIGKGDNVCIYVLARKYELYIVLSPI